MVTVSVIIPVYNAEHTLPKCLDALCNQTYTDFEVICVNDGSTDISLKILEEYSKRDARIIVLSQKNSGPAKARNYAISKAVGKYLMFCDSDDWYEPQMIEEMVNTIEEQNVDLVMCDCNICDMAEGKIQNDKNKKYNRLILTGYYNIEKSTFNKINVVLWNKIFKREIINKNNIIYPLKYEHDDMVFCYEYFLFAKNYYGLNKKLYNYVVGNANSIMGKVLTKTNFKHEYDFITSMQELYNFVKKHNPNDDYIEFCNKKAISNIISFYKILENKNKKKCYKITQRFIHKNPILLRNCQFKYINKLYRFKDFDNFIMKNEKKRKVIRVFGIKIKLKKEQIPKIFVK